MKQGILVKINDYYKIKGKHSARTDTSDVEFWIYALKLIREDGSKKKLEIYGGYIYNSYEAKPHYKIYLIPRRSI